MQSPADECREPAEQVPAAWCGDAICCNFEGEPAQTLTHAQCAERMGQVAQPALCVMVCCATEGETEITSELACERGGGQEVPEQNCAKVCCQLGDEHLDIGREDCENRGGVPAPSSWCEDDICCALPDDGAAASMPAERCAQVGGMQAEAALCLQVCCDYEDGGRRAGVMSNAECQARDGMSNADLCESMICCGVGEGVFRELAAQECTALGHVIVRMEICQEDDRGADNSPLTEGSNDAGVGDDSAGADGSVQGCMLSAGKTELPTPFTLLWLVGIWAARRRRS